MSNMSSWPKLTRAPTVEGLVDIRIEPSAAFTMNKLMSACEDLSAEFPSRQELRRSTVPVSLSPEATPSISTTANELGGFLLRSADEKWVAQFRLDGLTLSRLQPYGTWDELKTKASSLWDRYVAVAPPTKVVRLASRFINHVSLPLGESFEKTFNTIFKLSPSIPQAVAGYLLRVVVPFEAEKVVAILTQSLEGGGMNCIFDLDTFSECPEGFSHAEIWHRLEVLRDVKNQLFFDSLTKAAIERFK